PRIPHHGSADRGPGRADPAGPGHRGARALLGGGRLSARADEDSEKIDAILKESEVKGFGLEVRDGLSDDVLYAKNETKPRTPASVTKVLTAAAALKSIGGQQRLATTTSFDPQTKTVILNGGGDVLLSAGDSDPGSVNGHGGLRTLAEDT